MLKTTMAYNWTSASTPQGRERLKELMDGKITLVCRSIDGMHDDECYFLDPEYDISSDDSIGYMHFLDPSPSPEPRPSNDLLWEAWWASAKNWGAEHVLESEVRPRFQEWIATLEVDPYEEFDEDLQAPAWCMDCSKMIPFLEDSFALLGFHPTLGHCVIASNYGFTQVRDGRFSVVSYASEPREFMDSKSAADWCAAEKVWFIPPHGNHRPATQADPLAADMQIVEDAWDNGDIAVYSKIVGASLRRLIGLGEVEVNNG
jgi:hypothetical protein